MNTRIAFSSSVGSTGAFAAHASAPSTTDAPQLRLRAPGELQVMRAPAPADVSSSVNADDGWPLLPTLLPFAPRLGVPPSLDFGAGRALSQEVIDKRVSDTLSAMWLSVTALMIGADVLSLYIPSAMQEFHALADGQEQWLMLAGTLIYLAPLSMALLSRVLPRTANRIANVAAVALVATALVGGGSLEPHYLVATGAQLLIMSFVTYSAVFWPAAIRQELESTSVNLTVHPEKQTYGISVSHRF